MKNTIIGTAGHVDHGKTMLIKALTGIDADRLQEEKKRGITIELGFAHLDLPDGTKAGIVDVPGHEKFVKNMLAGIGGIDLVLLVVAADEGFMPQTREHLDILSMLDMKQGIIVLTKIDMVDEDWLEIVQEDVRSEVEGTFLEKAPMVSVSSYTGQGIDELRQLICDKLADVSAKNDTAPLRIPVDRVFSVDGFGTVITGTLMEGTIAEGDEVTFYPSGVEAKVRGVQVHSSPVPRAYAGQRVAVNLAGVKKEKLHRGDWLAAPDSLQNSLMLDVKLKALPHSERELLNNSQLHFHHGAGSCLCKLVLLDCDSLSPGNEAYAQLRFTEPVSVKSGDHFVVRFFSPIETVGGGVILDSHPGRHKRYDQEVLEGLHVKETGTPELRILQKYAETGLQLPTEQEVYESLGLLKSDFDEAAAACVAEGSLVRLSQKHLIHSDALDQLGQRIDKALTEYHTQYPLQAGMRREELRSRLLPGRTSALADSVIEQLARRGILREEGVRLCRRDFHVQYTPAQQELQDKIEAQFLKGGFEPPAIDEVAAQYAKQKDTRDVMEALFESGRLVLLTQQIAVHRDIYDKALALLKDQYKASGSITLGEFRDGIGTSRKYALALLEYFDKQQITRKNGDLRVLTRG